MENKPLSPSNEETCKIFDAFTREKFHRLEQQLESRERMSRYDNKYSLARLLHGMRENAVDRLAPYEWSLSQRVAEIVGREPRPGFAFLPIEPRQQRDMTAAGAGAFLMSTDVGPGNTFVHFLDSYFPFQRLGITRISLQRPSVIPGISGTVSTTWLANEGSTITEDQFTFAIQTSSPKTVGAYIEVSDRLLKQTSAFGQAFTLQALARAVSAELGRKLLTGASPSAQVQGIFGYPGVGSLAGGSANYSKVLDLIESVEAASAFLNPSAGAFVMRANVAKLLRSREKATGSGMIMLGGDVGGYPGIVTQGTSPNTLVFGDFSQLALLEYNILEISTDPFGANSTLFKSGLLGVRCLLTIDSMLLNPASFVTTGSVT